MGGSASQHSSTAGLGLVPTVSELENWHPWIETWASAHYHPVFASAVGSDSGSQKETVLIA
jgi:hypothetical protein